MPRQPQATGDRLLGEWLLGEMCRKEALKVCFVIALVAGRLHERRILKMETVLRKSKSRVLLVQLLLWRQTVSAVSMHLSCSFTSSSVSSWCEFAAVSHSFQESYKLCNLLANKAIVRRRFLEQCSIRLRDQFYLVTPSNLQHQLAILLGNTHFYLAATGYYRRVCIPRSLAGL